jgi:outer membrane protein
MKKSLIIIFVAGLISISLTSFSQNLLKVGHVNINEIMKSLPARDSAQVKLDKETKEIESTYDEMKVVYNKLVSDYQNGQSTYSELVKKAKEADILDKQQRIQEFEQNATTTLQQRSLDLFKPIYDKIIRAIEKVASENGFTYILDLSKESVVFTSKDSQNLNQQVLALLKK